MGAGTNTASRSPRPHSRDPNTCAAGLQAVTWYALSAGWMSRLLTFVPRTVPAIIPIPTLEPAIARLSKTLSNLTTSHSANVSAMTSAVDELAQIEEKEKELREAIERTEAQRSWFAAFREFVEGVGHFLDEKVRRHLFCFVF